MLQYALTIHLTWQLMNRFGHSESYSFSLELKAAIEQVFFKQTSNLLCAQMVRIQTSSVFQSEFDNFDQLLNNLTGQGSIHTANGIMM